MRLVRILDNYINDKKFSMIYTKILDFSSSKISIRYNKCIYYIYGDDLVISKMMDDEIFICGSIGKIIFE